jgi:AGCS family alanine or glycine:cation symporter
MYYIEKGLGKSFKPLAVMFAVFGVMTASLGSGTFTQVNAITSIVNVSFDIPVTYTAAVLTVLVAITTIGGLQSIAKVASKIVPFMAVVYVISAISVLVHFSAELPAAIKLVIDSAFNTTAATGGFLGASVMLAMRSGIARGIYSNEAGLGSAPIVAAAAKTKWAAEQGLVSMTGTFIDTIIICTMTGLTLVVSGVWCGDVNGAAMTEAAFSTAFPVMAKYMLTSGLVLFAFSTIIGWSYYGERCCEYLFGVKGIMPYRISYIVLVGCGVFLKLETIWVIADIVNGLMAIPNLIALVGLSGVVVAETKNYFAHWEKVNERKKSLDLVGSEALGVEN